MKLAYRKFGEGKALIILHGLFGQSDNWNSLAKQFAEKGFEVFAIDQRNHGLSPHSSTWDYPSMAEDLKEFISDHHLVDPILMGHSMGGKTVLFFQLAFPNLASKLIVVDIAARAYAPHHDKVFEALNAVNLHQIKTRKEAETILSQYLEDFGTKQFLLKNLYWRENETDQLAWRFNLKVIEQNYNHIGIAVPFFTSPIKTLILTGANSNYVNKSDRMELESRFSNCEFVSIEHANHWVHAEQPKAFFDAVSSFIAN